MSFLRARFALLNLSATFQQIYNRTDVEDENLTTFFNSLLPCACDRCRQLQGAGNRTNDRSETQNDETQNNGTTNQNQDRE